MAQRVLTAAGTTVEEGDRKHLADSITVLKGSVQEVHRFRPVMVAPREKEDSGGDEKMRGADSRGPPAVQVWILKLANTTAGNKVMNILMSFQKERVLRDLMDAGLTNGRAPAGSMARALQDVIAKFLKKRGE